MIEQLTLQPRTERTVSSAAELHNQIAQGRKAGYVYQSEEVDLGMNAIGAPVIDHNGNVLGAIAIAAPLFRATKTDLLQHRDALDTAAYQLAIALTTIQPRG